MGFAGLVAAVTFVAAASPVAIAATPSRQGRVPPADNRPLYRHRPLYPKTELPPPPSRGEIMMVIEKNLHSINVCYQRALAGDASLTTFGNVTVKLGIGISGRVKHVTSDGPPQFRILLEPCIKEGVSRWTFPHASEEYGAEFPFIFKHDYDQKEAGDGCSITVNSFPWSEVWIDGKNTTRHTPVVDFKLPCGKHKISFKRTDLDIHQTEIVSLRPGTKFMQRYMLMNND